MQAKYKAVAQVLKLYPIVRLCCLPLATADQADTILTAGRLLEAPNRVCHLWRHHCAFGTALRPFHRQLQRRHTGSALHRVFLGGKQPLLCLRQMKASGPTSHHIA